MVLHVRNQIVSFTDKTTGSYIQDETIKYISQTVLNLTVIYLQWHISEEVYNSTFTNPARQQQ